MNLRLLLAATLVASPLIAQTKTAVPAKTATKTALPPKSTAVADIRTLWEQAMKYVIESAKDVPEAKYSFKATPEVRSFGELFTHIAGSQSMFCAMALGQTPPNEDAVDKLTTKASIIDALNKSNRDCTAAYAQGDAALAGMVDVFGQQHTRLYALMMNTTHDNEHYGNLVTYLRLNKMVPPSSKPPAK